MLTKCDNPYTTKPRDEVGADILLLHSGWESLAPFQNEKIELTDALLVAKDNSDCVFVVIQPLNGHHCRGFFFLSQLRFRFHDEKP